MIFLRWSSFKYRKIHDNIFGF